MDKYRQKLVNTQFSVVNRNLAQKGFQQMFRFWTRIFDILGINYT